MNLADLVASLAERARSGFADARTVDADEVAGWPAGTLDELLREGVLAPTQPARSVICDGCDEDHVEEVEFVEWPPGSPLRAYIACPSAGRVAIEPERLRCWSIDRPALAKLAHDEADVVASQVRGDGFAASEDYRSVTLRGRAYALTESPALVVKMLNEAWERRTPEVRWRDVQIMLDKRGFGAGSMSNVFRHVHAWKDLITKARRGVYRLNR